MTEKTTRIRQKKMKQQGGRCFYCSRMMWTSTGESDSRKRKPHPLMQCTTEHLKPRSEGGADSERNIVAACLYCNQTRHKGKRPLDAAAYKSKVQKRLSAGRWLRL